MNVKEICLVKIILTVWLKKNPIMNNMIFELLALL